MSGGPEGGGNGLYDENGQVSDPQIAHEMANEEKTGHNVRAMYGGSPRPYRSENGKRYNDLNEEFAEEKGERLQAEKEAAIEMQGEINDLNLKSTLEGHWEVVGEIKGKYVNFKLYINPVDFKGHLNLGDVIVDGEIIDYDTAGKLYGKYGRAIKMKFDDQLNDNDIISIHENMRKKYLQKTDDERSKNEELLKGLL